MKHKNFTVKVIAETMGVDDPGLGMGEMPPRVDEAEVGLVQLGLDDWEVVMVVLNNAKTAALNPDDQHRLGRIADSIYNSLGDDHPEKYYS
jgi:hypothetical protein